MLIDLDAVLRPQYHVRDINRQQQCSADAQWAASSDKNRKNRGLQPHPTSNRIIQPHGGSRIVLTLNWSCGWNETTNQFKKRGLT